VESSSGRELKEQIYFLDIESGVCVCVCVSCGGEIALYKQQHNTDIRLPPQAHNELRTIKQTRQKLKNNEALVTKTDKGNSLVILYQKDYNTKVQNFIDTNHFQKEATDPTNKFQTEVRKNINLCTLVVLISQR
jgi:hypothetical protein